MSGLDRVLPVVQDGVAFSLNYRTILAGLLRDRGGADRLSVAKLQLLRRFAAGFVIAEKMEGQLARGEHINCTEYATLCNALVRIADFLGLESTKHEASPKLSDYLKSHNRDR